MNLEKGSKLLVVPEGDTILLRKIDESTVEASLEDVLKPMWEDAEGADMTLSDETPYRVLRAVEENDAE